MPRSSRCSSPLSPASATTEHARPVDRYIRVAPPAPEAMPLDPHHVINDGAWDDAGHWDDTAEWGDSPE